MPNSRQTPYFLLHKNILLSNLKIFEDIAAKTDIVWLYTLKAFHEEEGLKLIHNTFSGFSIGNLNELEKIRPFSDAIIHSYAPVFYSYDITKLAKSSTTISFNSLKEWERYRDLSKSYTSFGLRINPQLSLKQPHYCNPTQKQSRFGVAYEQFLSLYQNNPTQFEHLEGLHFHALCEQDFPSFDTLLTHISTYYKEILPKLKWLNLGGGQNFTHHNYNRQDFIQAINNFKKHYPHLTLYFEPGSAVVYGAGTFVCTILDILDATIPQVILNTSIETHMLDVAITKHSPTIKNISKNPTEYTYEITGISCIAGDIIGTYYFNNKLKIGDTIVFENMLGYSIVKQTEFNGIDKADFFVT